MKIDSAKILVEHVPLQMGRDEVVVRRALVEAWTEILEMYALPDFDLPSDEEVRQELFEAGVEAAVEALVVEHWFVWSFMVRGQIEAGVKKGLERFNIPKFMADVKIAQDDPEMLEYLRQKIRSYIMDGN